MYEKIRGNLEKEEITYDGWKGGSLNLIPLIWRG